MAKAKLDLPLGPIPDLLKWWKKSGVQGIVIGGLAVAIHTRARSTKDVDAVVLLEEDLWAEFLAAGEAYSFLGRLPDTLEFARKSRVFLLHHERSGVPVDLAIGGLSFEIEAMRRAQSVKVGRLSIPVATVEDLIVMKAVSNRLQDRKDIIQMLTDFENADLRYVRSHLDQFAQLLDEPELASLVDDLQRDVKGRKR